MKKQYQLFLCEDKIINGKLTSIPCYELAGTDNLFSGSAYEIEFYSKIDGTHTLSFKMPQYFFDENIGKYTYNSIIEHLINKAKIEVRKRDKSYLMVINEIEEKEDNGAISYSYSCSDVYIEELSKNGYGISFSDDAEMHNGLGTIHEFAEKIIKGTDWEYCKDNTGTLLEYKKELEYNILQGRYDYVHIPVPVHPVKYLPENDTYCQETKLFYEQEGKKYKVYCCDKTEQVTSNAVQNLIYNTKDFTDTSGWTIYRKDGNEIFTGEWLLDFEKKFSNQEEKYSLSLENIDKNKSICSLLNTTCAEAGKMINSGVPYYFRLDGIDNLSGWTVSSIEFYDGNPLIYKDLLPAHTLDFGSSFKLGREYVIRPSVVISKPYIVINFDRKGSNQNCYISEVFLFQITGQEVITNEGETISAEHNSSLLIQSLYQNGMYLEGDLSSFSGIIGTSYANGKVGIIQYPDTAIPKATTLKYVQYFYRKNYEWKDGKEFGINPEIDGTLHFLTEEELFNIANISKNDIITVNELPSEAKTGQVYHLTDDNKYYEYYSITYKERRGGKWDYAFLDEGNNDKRRTLSAEKSNRFNLIQELSELFHVWPVFNIQRNNDGTLTKQFWFKEDCINENFSGFHKDVNLISLGRTIDSNEIVTKMYVENQETDLSPNGFVSIVNSDLNPWGENYYYNFSYYVNQKILNTYENSLPQVQVKLEKLYREVKGLNSKIKNWNEELLTLSQEKREQTAKQKSLSVSIAAINERIAKLPADKKEYENLVSEDINEMPQYKNTLESLETYEDQKKKFEEDLSKINQSVENTEKLIEELEDKISTATQDKKDLVLEFESYYQDYIKEGVWADSSYSNDDDYYIDSLKVMATSSTPKITWQINVIDGSATNDLQEFVFEVGDKTILVDDSFFFSNEEGVNNFTFEVLISGIKECFDIPEKNEIEVRNYTTSFEELFTRISAATQSLQLNEQTYNKSAYFTVNGEIDASILQKTLQNNALVLASSVDNTYTVDDTGITVHKINNSNKQVRINAEGIFVASEVGDDGNPLWKTGITADGISADLITSGEINTSVIRIFSKGEPAFSWSNLGISAYEYDIYGKIKSDNFMRFDQFGLYKIKNSKSFNNDSEGKAWFEGRSREESIKMIKNESIVSITEDGFRLNIKEEGGLGALILGYEEDRSYGLYIKDNQGKIVVKLQNTGINEIAGWEIHENELSKKYTIEGEEFVTGFQIHGSGNVCLAIGSPSLSDWAQAPFYVTHAGILHATNAHIEGIITANEGHIGNWEIDKGGYLVSSADIGGKMYYSGFCTPTTNNTTVLAIGADDRSNWGNASFRVKSNGEMYAKNATIEGEIYAKKGNFSDNVTINGKSLVTYDRMYDLLTNRGNTHSVYFNNGSVAGWDNDGKQLVSKNGSLTLNAEENYIQVDKNTISYLRLHSKTVLVADKDGQFFSLQSRDVPCITFAPRKGFTMEEAPCDLFVVCNYDPILGNYTASLMFSHNGTKKQGKILATLEL